MYRIYHKISEDEILALRRSLMSSKTKFVDDTFPLKTFKKNLRWLRPHEICSDPQFFVEGISRFDINQGSLGNCWFMAAIDNLTKHKQLFQKVVCDTNSSFADGEYCGLFHFKFWHFGVWNDILIDDRLPTLNGKLIYVHSNVENEFWPALLEKAYAKLHGGYEKIVGGFITEAFSDLTGGVTETYDLKNPPNDFFNMIMKAFKRNVLMGCSKFRDTGKVGLPRCHAYSLSNVANVMDIYGNVTELVRVRNPWGNSHEYTGNWSDYSEKWMKITQQEKQRIGFKVNGDGEFWMSFNDFLFHFDNLEICNLTPDMLTRDPYAGREWKVQTYREIWSRDSKIKHEFLAIDPDPDDNEDYCTIVVALMFITQDRKNKKRLGLKITSANDKSFVKVTEPDDIARHENVFRFDILPGLYRIEIKSFGTQDTFEYLFRIFYETKLTNCIYPLLHEVNVPPDFKKAKKSNKKNKKIQHVKYYKQKKSQDKTCEIM